MARLGRLCAAASVAALLCLPLAASAGPGLTGSAATEACHTWAGARSLTGLNFYIGAAGWIMIFDDTAPPADGTVVAKDAGGDLVGSFNVLTAGSGSIWFDGTPSGFTNGIVVCASSTGPLTKTAYATAFFRAQVQ